MIQRTMASKKDVQALDKQVEALDTKVTEGGRVTLAAARQARTVRVRQALGDKTSARLPGSCRE
jgi:hypothetical protein